MKVAGIDYSTTAAYIAIFEDSETPVYSVGRTAIKSDWKAMEFSDTAWADIKASVLGILQDGARHVYIEEPIVIQNGATAIKLTMVATALYLAALENNMLPVFVNNRAWKGKVLPPGWAARGADKKAFAINHVIDEVGYKPLLTRFNAAERNNAADAICIAEYGLQKAMGLIL